MELTPDQLHVFQTTQRWRNFRQLFPNHKAALMAYSTAAQTLNQAAIPTHHIEWRHLYDDGETTFLAFLGLLSAPLGIHYSRQNEYRFITVHAFTKAQARQVMLGRMKGSLCYHVCFVLILLFASGFVFGLLNLLLGQGIDWLMVGLTVVTLMGCVLSWIGAAKSRSFGLPDSLKLISKDTFDLLSIKKVGGK